MKLTIWSILSLIIMNTIFCTIGLLFYPNKQKFFMYGLVGNFIAFCLFGSYVNSCGILRRLINGKNPICDLPINQ